MKQKRSIILPDLYDIDGNDILITTKISKEEEERLNEAGYSVTTEPLHYKFPSSFSNPFFLKVSLFIQDFLKGRVYNPFRHYLYLKSLKELYGYKLSDSQQKELDKLSEQHCKMRLYSHESGERLDQQKSFKLNKIILFASNSNGVGKTTTTQKLVDKLNADKSTPTFKASFAESIRILVEGVFTFLNTEVNPFKDKEMYNQFKNVSYKYDDQYERIVLRDLICDYSDLLQKHFGAHVWANQMVIDINNTDAAYIVIDDLRRPVELDYLIKSFGKDKILTVYLQKDDVNSSSLSQVANSYEGQLDPKDFDLVFNFNQDWSNSNELLDSIVAKLK